MKVQGIRIVKVEADVASLAVFQQLFPDVEVHTINGERADSQCEHGHLYYSDYHRKCPECFADTMCAEGCGKTNRDCDCIPF